MCVRDFSPDCSIVFPILSSDKLWVKVGISSWRWKKSAANRKLTTNRMRTAIIVYKSQLEISQTWSLPTPPLSWHLSQPPTASRRREGKGLQNNPPVVTTIRDNVELYWFICHNNTMIGVILTSSSCNGRQFRDSSSNNLLSPLYLEITDLDGQILIEGFLINFSSLTWMSSSSFPHSQKNLMDVQLFHNHSLRLKCRRVKIIDRASSVFRLQLYTIYGEIIKSNQDHIAPCEDL